MKYLLQLDQELKDCMFNINKAYFFLLFLLIFLFSTFYLKDFRIDASSDTLVAQSDEDFKYFNYYTSLFPTKNSLVIAIESKNKIDKNFLKEINKISDQLTNLTEVSSIFNINKAPILFLNNINLVDLSDSNYETLNNTNLNINDVLKEFSDSPIYSEQIINKKKNISSIIIYLKENKAITDLKANKELYLKDNTYYNKKTKIDEERNNLINKIRVIINKSNKDYKYYLGGIEMISDDVISFIKNDIIIFSLVVITLVIFILFILFKNIKWVLSILISSIFAVYIMIGLVGFLNFEITAVSANFLSLMFILSISMNIHIVNNYLQKELSLSETLQSIFWPCFYTFLTTIAAFISLVISDIKPVIDFGIVMIMSLFIILFTAFTFLPLIISLFKKNINYKNINFSILNLFYKYSFEYKKFVIFINLIIFIFSIYGISNLNIENSFIKYFKKETEIYKGMKLIDTELGGTTPIDIILEFNDDNITTIIEDDNEDIDFEDELFLEDLYNDQEVWFTNEKIEIIKKIHNFLEKREEIGKVVSIHTLIDVANKINVNDLSMFELSILYNEIPENYKLDLIDPYLNISANMIKISARVKDSEDIKRAELINDINSYINNLDENIFEFRVNGLLVLYNNMLSSLFSSQVKSLGFILIAIFIMFMILFKSIKLSIAGIIPNIIASSFILGLIGVLKIPLDIMTITIAAISIGIAVDNTIHYLYRYQKNISENFNFLDSIKLSHATVGRAVLITSLAISLGFLTLCFSNFVPTVIFGLFTCLAMIFAMIGVLITLPSILYYLK